MSKNYNENTELHALACLFKDGSLFPIIEDILEKKTFGYPAFGILFQAYKDVVHADLYPDIVTVSAELDKRGLLEAINIPSNGLKGQEALNYIAELDVNTDSLESYAFQILEFHGNREIIKLASEMIERAKEGKRPIETLGYMDVQSGKIAAFVGSQSKNVRSSQDVALSSVEQYEEARDGKSKYIPTGLSAWDDFTNGLRGGRLYMVTGRTGDGKSALIQNLIKLISVDNKIRTKLFTLEMSAEEVHNRLVQIVTGISPLKIENGTLTDNEIPDFAKATKIISESPVSYDDSPEVSLALLRTKIRKSVGDGDRVILIDQLEQLTIGGSGDHQPEHIKLNYITYRLKAYSREMDVPIIIAHQLNRGIESGDNRSKNLDPQTTDISQGGDKACDAILAIRKDKDGNYYFFWIKHRNGKKGKRPVEWVGTNILFKDKEGYSEFPSTYTQGEMV